MSVYITSIYHPRKIFGKLEFDRNADSTRTVRDLTRIIAGEKHTETTCFRKRVSARVRGRGAPKQTRQRRRRRLRQTVRDVRRNDFCEKRQGPGGEETVKIDAGHRELEVRERDGNATRRERARDGPTSGRRIQHYRRRECTITIALSRPFP